MSELPPEMVEKMLENRDRLERIARKIAFADDIHTVTQAITLQRQLAQRLRARMQPAYTIEVDGRRMTPVDPSDLALVVALLDPGGMGKEAEVTASHCVGLSTDATQSAKSPPEGGAAEDSAHG